MSSLTGSSGFRTELQRIADRLTGDSVGNQVGENAGLAIWNPHSIRLVGGAVPGVIDTFAFNCHALAFGIQDSARFKRMRAEQRSPYVADEFFMRAQLGSLLVELPAPGEGDIVVYFEGIEIQHSGIHLAGRVRSKWGTAHIWDHEVFEVLENYGSRVHYFRKVVPEDTRDALEAYVAKSGS